MNTLNHAAPPALYYQHHHHPVHAPHHPVHAPHHPVHAPHHHTAVVQNKENMRLKQHALVQKIKRVGDTIDPPIRNMMMQEARQSLNKENSRPFGSLTKKIRKVATHITKPQVSPNRHPLKDVTNYGENSNTLEHEETTPKLDKKPFLEDAALPQAKRSAEKTVKKTQHHAVLTYLNRQSLKKYQFSCFLDKELCIPEKYVCKTITHSVDNDVSTDEEQMKSAIRNLHRSIEACIKEQQKPAAEAPQEQ